MTDKTDKETKPKAKRGFAANPHLINKSGRPKGSRNKSSLLKAQLNIDDLSVAASELLEAMIHNDKATLGITDDVPIKMRMDAANSVLNKAIANEKDKVAAEAKASKEKAEDSPKAPSIVVSTKAVKKA